MAKKLRYTLLELEKEFRNRTCDFCSNRFSKDNKAVNEIITREEATNELVALNMVCENCKEKFENNELPKCEKCDKLQTKTDLDFFTGKYDCDCKEEKNEKELPLLPQQRESMPAFYERQINSLQEKLNTAEWTIHEEREAHEDFMEKSEEWGKRQKQELLDKTKNLEEEIRQLREENKQLKSQTSEELINKIKVCEAEIERLKAQLERLTSQQTAQIETPAKDSNKIKSFFKFSGNSGKK